MCVKYLELGLKIKIELSKDEIGTIRWDVSALIEDIESDFLNELADKDFRFYLVLRI